MSTLMELKVLIISNFEYPKIFVTGQWHCVKRQLPGELLQIWACFTYYKPECGNYDLESYLPVYLWKKHCELEGKDHFWELMTLLPKHQSVFCAEDGNNDSEVSFES